MHRNRMNNILLTFYAHVCSTQYGQRVTNAACYSLRWIGSIQMWCWVHIFSASIESNSPIQILFATEFAIGTTIIVSAQAACFNRWVDVIGKEIRIWKSLFRGMPYAVIDRNSETSFRQLRNEKPLNYPWGSGGQRNALFCQILEYKKWNFRRFSFSWFNRR